MDELNSKLNIILQTKTEELKNICNQKTKKMTKSNEDINYNIKTTIYKINAEQDRKLKSSKVYKNQEQLFNV